MIEKMKYIERVGTACGKRVRIRGFCLADSGELETGTCNLEP